MLATMESRDEVRDRLRAAEWGAAAPYVDYPKDPWWVVPGFGALASLFVLGVNIGERADVPDVVAALLMALVALSSWGYVSWQRRRRGTAPSGKAPREIDRVLWWFVVGAVVVAVALFVLADWAPLWLGVPVAFVLTAAGMFWFGSAYARASAKVRERLA